MKFVCPFGPALGRHVKSIDALTNTITCAYTRDLLTSITYAYDALKRLASKTYPGSTSVTYTFQGQQLTQVTDTTVTPNETHTFAYDASYRVQSTTEGPRGTVSYTYTADDRPATMGISGGPTTTYAYYPDGSLDTIDWSLVTGQFKYTYTLTGQYETITFPNGQIRSYGYDDQGRLTQLANVHPTAGTLASFAYGYDVDQQTQQLTLLGQRTSLAMTIPSQSLTAATSTYRYDSDYQLIQASYPAPSPYNGEVHSWTYDAIGNRLTNTVDGVPQTYTYFKNGANPLNGQRLSSDGDNAYTYDANGNNLTRTGSGGNFTFAWDADDRMTAISDSATASYGYDYQGRRTSKTVSGTTTNYLYDGLSLIRATAPSNTVEYLFGPGIDEPLATVQGGSVSYFSVDGLGSVHNLSDTTGTVQDAYLYDAWGVIRGQNAALANDFGFTAREFGEAGLWFYRARYYQTGIGRFVREDPWRNTDNVFRWYRANWGVNLYPYAGSNPVFFVDPTGFDPCCDCPGEDWGWSGGGGGLGVIYGHYWFSGTFTCKSKPSLQVEVAGGCTLKGPFAFAGREATFSAGMFIHGAKACNVEDLFRGSKAVFANFWFPGLPPLGGGVSGDPRNGTGSLGIGVGIGGGVGSMECKTRPGWWTPNAQH